MEVITSAVEDNIYYRNANLKQKQGRHWKERRDDGKMAETFLLSDFDIYFDYIHSCGATGFTRDLVIQEMLSRIHDPEAWGTS